MELVARTRTSHKGFSLTRTFDSEVYRLCRLIYKSIRFACWLLVKVVGTSNSRSIGLSSLLWSKPKSRTPIVPVHEPNTMIASSRSDHGTGDHIGSLTDINSRARDYPGPNCYKLNQQDIDTIPRVRYQTRYPTLSHVQNVKLLSIGWIVDFFFGYSIFQAIVKSIQKVYPHVSKGTLVMYDSASCSYAGALELKGTGSGAAAGAGVGVGSGSGSGTTGVGAGATTAAAAAASAVVAGVTAVGVKQENWPYRGLSCDSTFQRLKESVKQAKQALADRAGYLPGAFSPPPRANPSAISPTASSITGVVTIRVRTEPCLFVNMG
ncbi:hypothetical protein M0802_000983 [Mischocyttarus mexicanus]|nr:hypothetical protein M0802_000983 [Mischocyttarus mexicanus]